MRITRVVAVAGTAALSAAATWALAGHTTGHTNDSAGALSRVRVVRNSEATNTSSTSYINLTGASTTMPVPKGESDLLLVTFSAESDCFDQDEGPEEAYCSVRILIDGTQALPVAGTDGASGFDHVSQRGGTDPPNDFSAHSIQRSRRVGGGTHTIQVQWKVTSNLIGFELDDWHLTVMRFA